MAATAREAGVVDDAVRLLPALTAPPIDVALLMLLPIVAGVIGLACTLILRDRPLRTASELRSGATAAGGDRQTAA